MPGADENRITVVGEGEGHHHEQEQRRQQEQQQSFPFETTTVLFGNNGLFDLYECDENALPRVGITDPNNVELNFQYLLYEIPTVTDDIVQRNVRTIESHLTQELAKSTLQCSFTEESENYLSRRKTPFQVSNISPFPVDQVIPSSECPIEKQRGNLNCYVVSAGFTPAVFYITDEIAVAQAEEDLATQEETTTNTQNNGDGDLRRRSLEDSQTKQELYKTYGPILDDLLSSSGGISALDENIKGAKFHGFVVNPSSSAAFGDHEEFQQPDGTELSTIALVGNNRNPNPPKAGFILGIFMICMAAISLAVFVIVLSKKKESKRVVQVSPPKNYNDESDDDSNFEHNSYEDDQEVDTNP